MISRIFHTLWTITIKISYRKKASNTIIKHMDFVINFALKKFFDNKMDEKIQRVNWQGFIKSQICNSRVPIKNHLFTRYKIRKFSLSIQTNELPKFQQGEKFGPFDFRFLKFLSPFFARNGNLYSQLWR